MYYALRVTLYEFPVAWFHHAMLVALLSRIEPEVPAPRFDRMGMDAVYAAFWSDDDQSVACAPERLEGKPLLWRAICLGAHPAYTFDGTRSADVFAASLRQRVKGDVIVRDDQQQPDAAFFCHRRAAWRCDTQECYDALQMAYNTTHCQSKYTEFSHLDPCGHPELFALQQRERVDAASLRGGPSGGIAAFMHSEQQRLLAAADNAAVPIDYIAEPAVISEEPAAASAIRIRPFFFLEDDTRPTDRPAFNMTDWLLHGVCRESIGPEDAVCSNQDAARAPTDPCLYAWTVPPQEVERYFEPGIDDTLRLYYATGAAPTEISVCRLFERAPEREVCILQYGGNMDAAVGLAPQAFVPCDIQAIEAPPGIEVQAFAVQRPATAWFDTLTAGCGEDGLSCPADACVAAPPDITSCTWRTAADTPTRNAWWYNGSTFVAGPSEHAFGRMQQSFEDMSTWWKRYDTEWRNAGCGLHSGVCALRVRMERSAQTRAACAIGRDAPPVCNVGASTPFRVARGAKHDLYRCAPCTRHSPFVAPESNDALFGCYVGDARTGDPILNDGERLVARNGLSLEYLQRIDPTTFSPDASLWQRNRNVLELRLPLSTTANPASMRTWAGRECDSASACGWPQYSVSFTIAEDDAIWSKALQNPDKDFTMVCREQPYTHQDARACNPRADARRQRLAEFVEARYRRLNGARVQSAPPRSGVRWRANVAHSAVGMFSLAYAASNRPPHEVRTEWLLGDAPCSEEENSVLPDRICLESTEQGGSAFEPIHPWLGGNYNPFEGLDECPGTTGALCPCECAPQTACPPNSTLLKEFVRLPACARQAFPQTRTLREDDPSNLCAAARRLGKPQKRCLHPQGLLGGAVAARGVTSDELHGEDGVETAPADFDVQELLAGDPSLWAGGGVARGRYGFLRMPRHQLHPAHIAFAVDDGTLVVAGIALLPSSQPAPDVGWVATLRQQWAADARQAAALYPQLLGREARSADWSCPLRAVAFWGGASPSFAPLLPHPPLMARLYENLGGAHPFIATRSLAPDLAPYRTTNGACFYRYDAPQRVPLEDARHACGLRRMLLALGAGEETESAVVEPFERRCMRILDAPDAGGTLRSGEKLTGEAIDESKCGALHRLTPFTMRIRPDAGRVTPLPGGVTTRDRGGDCHMGRALLWPIARREEVAGTQCALTAQNETHAVASCPYLWAPNERIVFRRARPLSLQELLPPQKRRAYRAQGLSATALTFLGPGGVEPSEADVSFGMLYATPLRRALARDLVENGIAPGPAAGFTERYVAPRKQKEQEEATARQAALRLAQQRDDAAWNATPGLDRERWWRDRFGACDAHFFADAKKDSATVLAVKAISLCEPAPTPAMQAFCKALLQYRTDISIANCQAAGDCLHNPGAFYTPYAWITPNKEFAADTLIAFYKSILLQPRFMNESYTALCPARNDHMARIAALSRAQAQQCPAFRIEYLKQVLRSVKKVGKDLLELGYCVAMFCANALGSIFFSSAEAMRVVMSASTHYLKRALDIVGRILMPIVNAVVNTVFGTSSMGKGIRDTLRVLCNVFDGYVNKFLIPIWCSVFLPALRVVLGAIGGIVGAFNQDAANKVNEVWTAISGGFGVGSAGDVQRCINGMAVAIVCNPPDADVPEPNGTQFLPQPLATRCWVTAGGGITASNYLSCTASDTCALDSTRFDAYDTPLLACASCPDGFGCNTYLKRCTCGVPHEPPGQCASAYDCATAVCAVSSNIEDLSHAFAGMPCRECAAMGMQPACVEGACGCVNVGQAGAMHACDPKLRGRRVPLLQATGHCLATTSNDLKPLSSEMTVDFSTLAIVPCIKGLADNACLGVMLPLSSGLGQYARPLVVVFLESISAARHRRALLAYNNNDRSNETLAAIAELVPLNNSRDAVKHAVHWRLAALQAGLADADALLHPFSAARTMLSLAQSDKHEPLREILAQHAGLVMPLVAGAIVAPDGNPQPNRSSNATENPSLKHAGGRAHHQRKLLLQLNTPTIKNPFAQMTCEGVRAPLAELTAAFWVTVTYYQNGQRHAPNQSSATDEFFAAAEQIDASTPPTNAGLVGAVADAMAGGMGRKLVAAFIIEQRGQNRTHINAHRLLRELSTCNYTTLTLAPPAQGGLIYIITVVGAVFMIGTCLCSPPTLFAMMIWLGLFPMSVLWTAYGISPLCFPMIPPRMPADIEASVQQLVPDPLVRVPRFAVSEECTLDGRMSDGSFSHGCFKQCSADPFLMRGWQDALAWWACELSPPLARGAAAAFGTLFRDFAGSVAYFAEVVAFSAIDQDFVAAHRLCALAMSHHILLALFAAAVGVLVLPHAAVAFAEIFASAATLLLGLSATQALEEEEEAKTQD